MRAVVCEELGPPGNLKVREIAPPRPGPGQLLIEVRAASVNYLDALIVQGGYQEKPPLPFSPGAEAAGMVVAVGSGVTRFAPGDRVLAFAGSGCFAEFCLADIEQTVPLPADLSYEDGSAFLLTYGTSLHALRDVGSLRAGETLLVLGAAGGVGAAAVEIGRALGARVIAAASTPEKLEFCRTLGAQDTINYVTENLQERALELTGGAGVALAFDPVGGEYTEAAFRTTTWRGRLLVVGFAAGDIPRVPLHLALLRERVLAGVYWGDWIKRDPEGHRRNVHQLVDWIQDGTLRLAISERLNLEQVPDALVRTLARQTKGKLLVLPYS